MTNDSPPESVYGTSHPLPCRNFWESKDAAPEIARAILYCCSEEKLSRMRASPVFTAYSNPIPRCLIADNQNSIPALER